MTLETRTASAERRSWPRGAFEWGVATLVGGLWCISTATGVQERGTWAQQARLEADAARLRVAIDAYRSDHGGALPGVRDSRDPSRPSRSPAFDVERQLGLYTDSHGRATERRAPSLYGPYLSEGRLPANAQSGERALAVAPIAIAHAGWLFDAGTGSVRAFDPTTERVRLSDRACGASCRPRVSIRRFARRR